jgi:hypothetical protein
MDTVIFLPVSFWLSLKCAPPNSKVRMVRNHLGPGLGLILGIVPDPGDMIGQSNLITAIRARKFAVKLRSAQFRNTSDRRNYRVFTYNLYYHTC